MSYIVQETLVMESLFNKVVSLQVTLLEKTPTQAFSCETCETIKNTYFEEHLLTTASEISYWQTLTEPWTILWKI